ncbi:NALCN channel auxiliary factor 1-like isoform X2 [Cololabis saira]|uniref:NALCN channel auxiliary factor 1-like isoform X2 n=1 Tax=Cololabis saira TaxID=129043 RepID=UPI002AD562BF|nr:NALCN channel auxiliary factor 1-like isoform X2 [Cololabis saira]
MTRGAGTGWQQEDDDGFQIWNLEPARDPQKPYTDSERAQRWRLSLASLLFLTILLSDQLWFCAEARVSRTRDKSSHSPPQSPPAANSSLTRETHTIFLGNSTVKHLWRLETCHRRDSLLFPDRDCFTFADADELCEHLSVVNMSNLYLSFCDSYSLLDLFGTPDRLNCSVAALRGGDAAACSKCVQKYQHLDQHAQEKYEDFELLTLKYEPGAYSVRTCMERCKMAYKHWLCDQYFPSTQQPCQKVPCHQYCLEVQQSCPFILPDNDDLIHGGNPSFICTGLLGNHPSDNEARCCDVRWDSRMDNPSGGTLKRTASSCEPEGASVTSAATQRLCSGRLKICLLALVLLHTVIIISASHNSTLVGVAAIFSPEEGASNEE